MSASVARRARARRSGLRIDRKTMALGATALVSTGVLAAGELARVWRRGSAPLPTETTDVLGAAEEAVAETVEVAVTGYRTGSTRENALLNLLGSFSLTFAIARMSTYVIRRRGRFGPIHNFRIGGRHIHHFVPGIVLAFACGGAALLTREERLEPVLAVPFGIGVGLTLDESALLLELDDVYWTREGILSVQITLAVAAMLAALALGLRFLRRGEEIVLDSGDAAGR